MAILKFLRFVLLLATVTEAGCLVAPDRQTIIRSAKLEDAKVSFEMDADGNLARQPPEKQDHVPDTKRTFEIHSGGVLQLQAAPEDPNTPLFGLPVVETKAALKTELAATTVKGSGAIGRRASVGGQAYLKQVGKQIASGATHHWGVVGDVDRFNSDKPPECLEDSATTSTADKPSGNKLGVKCCTDGSMGAQGSSEPCLKAVGFEAAKAHCESQSLHLCTRSQIEEGAGVGTGCGLDRLLVWTSDACGETSEVTGGETGGETGEETEGGTGENPLCVQFYHCPLGYVIRHGAHCTDPNCELSELNALKCCGPNEVSS
jgi:hypothetical protein